MSMLFTIMIIVIVVLIIKNKNLKQENKNLKVVPQYGINFCPKCGYNFNNRKSNFCPNCGHDLNIKQNNIEVIHKEEPKYTDKEIKNNLILVLGSILIVFASIVFLTSTWDVIHNVVKFSVLLFMLAVFLAVSFVSDKYFNLKQTSKTFYYISLAYIPIILLAISIFSFFGNYLSLYGEGKYIYLTLSSILVSIIYYFDSIKKNNKTIFIFSVIAQVLSVICLTLIISNDFGLVLTGLLIYSLIISILYLTGITIFDKKIHFILSIVLCIAFTSLSVIKNLFIVDTKIYDVLILCLSLINIYISFVKIHDKNNIYRYIYPILIILTFNSMGNLFDNFMFHQALILASFATIYIYNIIREKRVDIISFVEVLVCFSIVNFSWLFVGLYTESLDQYILYSVMTLLNLVMYTFNNKYKSFASYILAVGLIITAFAIEIKFDLPMTIIGFVSFALVLVEVLFKKVNLKLRKAFKIVGIISLGLITLVDFDIIIYDIILYTLYFAVALISFIKEKDNTYKIISYIYSNVVLLSIISYFGINLSMYVFASTTILIIIAQILISNLKNKINEVYIVVSSVISLFILNMDFNIPRFIMLIMLCLVYVYNVVWNKKDDKYLLVPLLGIMPYTYFNMNFYVNGFNTMYILSIIIISILFLLMFYKKKNFYIILLYIYSFMHIANLENIKYIGILILIISSLGVYFIKEGKEKDIFKGITLTLLLVVFNFIISDLNLSHITAFTSASMLLFVLIFTRIILKNINGFKIWEYILLSIVNLIAIVRYSDTYDGIIFVAILAVLVIVSYILKFGPTFLVCLISIILNLILLIRMLWIEIPWWIYILIIGIVLISFAVYNEIREKNNKESIRKKLDL